MRTSTNRNIEINKEQGRMRRAQVFADFGDCEYIVESDTLSCSDNFLRILALPIGYPLTLRQYFSFVKPDDGAIDVETLFQFDQPWVEHIYRVILRDGDVRWIRNRWDFDRDIDGQVLRIYGAVQDVTEHAQTDQVLRMSDKLAIVGELAAGVAHEIRNPLTTLKGFLQLLDSAVCDRAKQREYYQIMRDALNDIEFIAGEMLVLAKPQVTKTAVLDIIPLIRVVVSLLNAEAHLHNVEIEVKAVLHQHPLRISGDASQLKQVMVNIMKNAIEAMPTGGKLTITVRNRNGQIEIRFQDDGCGIAPERISKLGEPFYTTKEKGTGLGLTVSRKILVEHKGTIHVSSTLGEGTRVTISLPAV